MKQSPFSGLKAFAAVARERTFARAAALLGVSQSALRFWGFKANSCFAHQCQERRIPVTNLRKGIAGRKKGSAVTSNASVSFIADCQPKIQSRNNDGRKGLGTSRRFDYFAHVFKLRPSAL